jgi:hypothetical protein
MAEEGPMNATKHVSIQAFNEAQTGEDREICERLRRVIDRELPEAESRIWHAHPVWFLEGNPIVGYSKLKACVRLLFWSGQSFETPGLTPEGTFKAAEMRFTAPDQVDEAALARWIAEARTIQWDYRNLMKKKRLERLF